MHDDPIAPFLEADTASFRKDAEAGLDGARSALARFKALPAEAGFIEVVDAFDALARPMDWLSSIAHLFFQVHPDAEMRSAGAEMEQELQRFATELSLDAEVYERLAALDLEQAPDAVTRRIVEHALRDFRRAGVDRDEVTRDRVRALREELVEIGQEFARNIASDVRSIRIPEGHAGLDGLPQDWIENHPEAEDGSVEVTTEPTDYLTFMKYGTDRDRRRELYLIFAARGAPANLPVLEKMLARRNELAGLLGYETFADYATEDKMIGSADNAARFIDRVVGLTRDRVESELVELLEAIQADHPEETFARDYDRFHYVDRVRAAKYDFDARDARPYFSYDAVTRGVIETSSRLYGISFRKAEVPVWHEDVVVYDVVESEEVIARLFLDMHPRADKYKHAAMFDLVSGRQGERVPQACLVCNFPRPTDTDPGLMEPRDATTYFHEFGHLLHHLLSGRHPYVSVSGIATEWDFVEVPSQLFEEWARDPDVLAGFAHHHETGEPIPADLVRRMREAEEYGKGLNAAMQMFYAELSLEYYRRDPEQLDTTAVVRELKSRHVPFAPFEEGTSMQTAFGHLDGYNALYYTYMWSLVLAKDIYSAFDGDLMNTETAKRYRETILAPGGSRDAADLVEAFLGRPFGFEAFERWLAA